MRKNISVLKYIHSLTKTVKKLLVDLKIFDLMKLALLKINDSSLRLWLLCAKRATVALFV